MSYLLDDLMGFEKTAWVQKVRLDKRVMNHKVNMRKYRLYADAQDIELGIMQPKEKIKPKFRTMEKRRFNQFTEDSDRSDKIADQMYDRRMRRHEVKMERIKAEREANEAKYKIQEQASQKEWDQFFADTKKSESRRRVKPFALAGAGAAALGGGAYLYNRYKKKKRAQAEQEKTANVERAFGKVNNYFEKNPELIAPALVAGTVGTWKAGSAIKNRYEKHKAKKSSERIEQEVAKQWADPKGRASIIAELKADEKAWDRRNREVQREFKRLERNNLDINDSNFPFEYDEMKEWRREQARKIERS